MNVIISQDKSVRFTQESSSAYNIQDISFYISKQIEIEDVVLKLKSLRSIYPFVLGHTGETSNYDIYKVFFTQKTNLSAKDYALILSLNGEDINLGTHNFNVIKGDAQMMMMRMSNPMLLAETGGEELSLTDEHDPIEVVDRDIVISSNKNILIAEDNLSQEIRFRIDRVYDGVDRLTSGMNFQFDYILSETNEYGEAITINKTMELVAKEDDAEHTEDTMLLSLIIPYELTQKAGTIPFAIRITKDAYTWQTKPSSLTVLKNLYRLDEIEYTPAAMNAYETLLAEINRVDQSVTEQTEAIEEMSVALEEQEENITQMSTDIGNLQTTDANTAAAIAEMQAKDINLEAGIQGLQETTSSLGENLTKTTDRVTAIEGSDIYGVDDNPEDEEVIFGGGGAPIEEV